MNLTVKRYTSEALNNLSTEMDVLVEGEDDVFEVIFIGEGTPRQKELYIEFFMRYASLFERMSMKTGEKRTVLSQQHFQHVGLWLADHQNEFNT